MASYHRKNTPIAIVGMSAILPDALTLDKAWRNIVNGHDSIRDVPPSHWLIKDYYQQEAGTFPATYSKRGAFLADIPFDPTEFGMPPNTLSVTDTNQLLGLLAAKQLLHNTKSIADNKVSRRDVSVILGVAAGTEMMDQMSSKIQKPVWAKVMREHGVAEDKVQLICENIMQHYPDWNENTFPGLLTNVVAGRIANRLDLGGCNFVVDAACASSLAAIDMAMKELHNGTSDMVLTGGVDALNNIFMYMCFTRTPALSPTDDIRPFSNNGDGTILGEGVVMLALRRLADAERDGDEIYAVIRACGSSSDGKFKSIYGPSSEGQSRAINKAYAALDYNLADVGLIEAHGTGTKAGDLAEFNGLQLAMAGKPSEQAKRSQSCALGSIKSQIGHTKSAAGAAGLFKIVQALHHKLLPPTIKVDSPNPAFNISETPFYLNTRARPWVQSQDKPRRAGVSSFGFGGSNFHLAVEEYCGAGVKPKRIVNSQDGMSILFVLHAKNTDALKQQIAIMRGQLVAARVSLLRLARQSQENFDTTAQFRLSVLAENKQELDKLLASCSAHLDADGDESFSIPNKLYFRKAEKNKKTALLFSGQGSQYLNMGLELLCQFDEARQPWDVSAGQEWDGQHTLAEVVYPIPTFTEEEYRQQEQRLNQLEWIQPALGALALSHLEMLHLLELKADCVAGHSYGEVPALYAAGVIQSPQAMLAISALRAKVMKQAAASADYQGGMTAVMTAADDVERLIDEKQFALRIANRNSPNQVVITGRVAELDKLETVLNERAVRYRRLNVPTAFHSELMHEAAQDFYQALGQFEFSEAKIPVYSNLSGAFYPNTADEIKTEMAMQLGNQVLFQNEIEKMLADGVELFIELGPGNTLANLVKDCLPQDKPTVVSMDAGAKVDSMTAFWRALAVLVVELPGLNLKRLWQGFALEEEEPRLENKSKAAVMINGANYGKRYPPADGVADLPAVNRETNKAITKNTSSQSHAIDNQPNHFRVETKTAEQGVQPEKKPMSENKTRTESVNHRVTVNNDQSPVKRSNSDWLRAIQQIQQTAFEAQQTFQQTLADSHRAYLHSTERVLQQLCQPGRSFNTDTNEINVPLAPPRMTPPPKQQVIVPPAPMAAPVITQSTVVEAPMQVVMEEKPVPITTATITPAADRAVDFEETLLRIVAEKTGYPQEMLELDMALESSLGIDSIKRVEILSALENEIPALKAADTTRMTALNTLGEILVFAQQTLGSKPETITTVVAEEPASSDSTMSVDFESILLRIVAEKTGYPQEMLELDMALESSLGIDSIKRVEILSALENEIPALKAADTTRMTALNTLGEILEFAQQSLAGDIPEKESPTVNTSASPEAKKKHYRYPVTKANYPYNGLALRGLHGVASIHIVPDNRGVAQALLNALSRVGINSAIISADEVSQQELGEAVIYLAGLNTLPHDDENNNDTITICKHAFAVARALGQTLHGSAGLFVTVQDSTSSHHRAVLGGISALVKTAAKEWQHAGLKSIEIDSTTTASAEIAETIVYELIAGGDEIEIVYEGNERYHYLAAEVAVEPQHHYLKDNDVILVSGGLRGVTAECLIALAQRQALRLAILARTPLDDEMETTRSAQTDAELKKILLQRYQQQGEKLTPMQLQQEVASIFAQREMRSNMARLQANGAEVVYYSTDIADRQAVTDIVQQVRQKWGSIDGIIHGAGVLADKLIHEKTDAQFNRVFDTKVNGFINLLQATANDKLSLICCFSSVAARTGNAGQVDYAMANEVLNKLCQAESQWRNNEQAACLVKSINWGPWDGGMVSAQLKQHFAQQGVGLLPIKEGAEAMADELEESLESTVEVVISGALDKWAGTPAHDSDSRWVYVHADELGFLASHSIKGHVVIPVALVTEWFFKLGETVFDALSPLMIRDMHVVKGIRVEHFTTTGDWYRLFYRQQGDELLLELRDNKDALCYKAVLCHKIEDNDLNNYTHDNAIDASNRSAWKIDAADIYPAYSFHGPELQIIKDLGYFSKQGASALVECRQGLSGIVQSWYGNPAILDGAIQVAVLWRINANDQDGLPTAYHAIYRYKNMKQITWTGVELFVIENDRYRTKMDVLLRDELGEKVALIEGLVITSAGDDLIFRTEKGFAEHDHSL